MARRMLKRVPALNLHRVEGGGSVLLFRFSDEVSSCMCSWWKGVEGKLTRIQFSVFVNEAGLSSPKDAEAGVGLESAEGGGRRFGTSLWVF